MVQVHRTYKVKENDTIKGVAKKYGLDTEELINYHNRKAEQHEQIRNRIPDFLREIILPQEGYILKNGKEIWANENEPEPLKNDKPFRGNLNNQILIKDISYVVSKLIKSDNKETTIAYQTNLRFYQEETQGSNYVSIDITSKTFINNEEASLVAQEMALHCIEVLYPLVLKIDKKHNLLEIQNHKEILSRWEKQKSTKLKYYQGEVAENYFRLFEQTLKDKELLLSDLKKDWFINIYFNNIYSTYYPKDKQKEEIVTFPIIPNTASVQFTVKKSAKISAKKSIRVDTKGLCTDKRTKTELESKRFFPSLVSNKPSVNGNYRAVYFLKPENHNIESAFLECSLELNKIKYVSISISEIDDTLDKEVKRHPKTIKLETENEPSFWKRLFS